MKNIYLMLVFACFLTNCTVKDKTSGFTTIDLRETLTAGDTEIELEELTSVIKEVPLETTDSSLIADINKLIYDGNNFYIVSTGKCFIFDSKGKFINRFGHKGDDPEGYTSIEQVLYTPERLMIFDSSSRKILRYNNDGIYQNQIKAPDKFKAISILKSGNYIGYNPNETGHVTMHFGLFDTNGNLNDSVPYRYSFESKVITVLYNEGSFFNGNNQLNFKEILSDTIFMVNELKFTPRFVFELGDKRARTMARAEMDTPRDNLLKNMATVTVIGETDTYLIVKCKGMILCNKQTGENKKVKINYKGEKFGTFFISEDGKYLIGSRNEEENNQTLILAQLK